MYKQLKKERELLDEKYKENEGIIKELDEHIAKKENEQQDLRED